MSKYITVSTKVKRELREKAKELGINISEVLRKALEEEIRRRELEELRKRLEALSDALNKIDIDRIVRGIKEDRERR